MGPRRALFALLAALAASASVSLASPADAPLAPCVARYDRAVAELRRGRARACLDDLDALLRACAADDGSRRADRDDAPGGGAPAAASDDASASLSLLAKAHFLRAEILLLDGAWDAAARAALDASSDGIAPPDGIGVASRVAAFRRRVSATRALAADASAHLARGRHERAFASASAALRVARRAASLYLLRAKTAVRLDLRGVAVADVADFLRLDPTARSRPAALATRAEARRRSARTTDALATAARVLRDCLRVDPDAEECREPLASATRLLALHENATALEEAREWDDAADAWRAFRQADDEKLFGLEQEAGSCRAESFAARKAAGLFDSDSPRGDGRSFLFGEEDERGNGGKEGASSFKHVPPLAFPAAARAKAESAIRRCGSAAPALEAAASDGVAGEGAVRAAVALARNRVDRGWARLVRGDADAARSDAESARRALDDVARFLPAGGEEGDDAGGDAAARETETTLGSPETADASSRFSLDFSQDFFSGGANAGEPWASYAAAASASSLVADARRGAARLARAAKALAEALEPKDLYAVLGLTRDDASRPDWLAVLKRAYRRLALMFHPDKNPEDPEAASARFLDVSEAYKILANDDLRRRYDETGDPGVDRGFDRGGGFSRGARASAGPAGDSRRFDRAWSFRYDRRDVGADGFARGRWTHKTTGEEVDGERDVRGGNDGGRSGARDPCRRKHACLEGSGGAAPRPTPRGFATRVECRVVSSNGERNAAAATLVVNHLGLQTLEVRFVVAWDRGEARGSRESRTRDGKIASPRAASRGGAHPSAVTPASARLVRARLVALARAVAAALTPGDRAGPGTATLDRALAADVAAAARGPRRGTLLRLRLRLLRLLLRPRSGTFGDPRSRSRLFSTGAASLAGGRGPRRADLREAQEAVRALATETALPLRLRGAVFPSARRDSGSGVGDPDAFGFGSTGLTRAAEQAAEALAENPEALRRVLAPEEAVHRGRGGAAEEALAGDTNDRWVYAQWGADADSDPARAYAVRPGDALAYEIKWFDPEPVDPDDPVMGRDADADEDASDGGFDGAKAAFPLEPDDGAPAYASLDAETSDGERLSATDATDQYGLLARPGADLRAATRSRGEAGWLARRIALPGAWRGKRIRRWMVACERDGPARTKVWIRNVRVVGADGEEAHVALASEGKPREVWDEEEEEEDGFGFGGGGGGEEW